ncbi:unnamed protein product, partial [Laminaria digitata]
MLAGVVAPTALTPVPALFRSSIGRSAWDFCCWSYRSCVLAVVLLVRGVGNSAWAFASSGGGVGDHALRYVTARVPVFYSSVGVVGFRGAACCLGVRQFREEFWGFHLGCFECS